MAERDDRELFIRRVVSDLQMLWLANPEKTFLELLDQIGADENDETFAGNASFEVEQYLEGE